MALVHKMIAFDIETGHYNSATALYDMKIGHPRPEKKLTFLIGLILFSLDFSSERSRSRVVRATRLWWTKSPAGRL